MIVYACMHLYVTEMMNDFCVCLTLSYDDLVNISESVRVSDHE